MIINCTPHAIDVYGVDAPDLIDPSRHRPVHSYTPSGTVTRILEQPQGGRTLRGAESAGLVQLVEYAHVTDLPPVKDGTWYIVALVVALALPARPDLLVSWRQVRNSAGTVVGCRALARPS